MPSNNAPNFAPCKKSPSSILCSKCISFLEFIDLKDLKSQLKQNGYRSVHLREFGAFDDYGCLVKQDIAIGNIHIDYINWCNSEGNRHLELSRK